jgi:NADP-dependent 3-hydroxy acid dehydrogenase YdfG
MNVFDGRVCVVTGASGGIGGAVSVALARSGAKVWALGRNEERLSALVSTSGTSVPIEPLSVDLEVGDEVAAAVATIARSADRVDALVHGAGVIAIGDLETLSASEFDRQYRVNLRAPFLLTQALLPHLRDARGHVVLVNSSAADRPSANNVLYAATKAGLKALADGLRDQLNADGVRVTTVFLGRTATPMQADVHEREGRRYVPELLLQPEDVATAIVGALMLPATAEATEIFLRPARKASES